MTINSLYKTRPRPASEAAPPEVSLERFVAAVVEQAIQGIVGMDNPVEDKQLARIEDRLENLEGAIGEISTALRDRLPKMAGLDELHEQHAKLVSGFFEQQCEAVYGSLIPVLDRLDARMAALEFFDVEKSVEELLTETARLLKGAKVEMLTALASYGLEPFQTRGTRFVPASQQAVSMLKCECASRDGCIARRLRPGYRHGNKVIRPELVEVYSKNDNEPEGSGGEI